MPCWGVAPMAKLADFPQQHAVAARLQALLAAQKLTHAYLFSGPAGAGKAAMARAFAQAMLCDAAGADACGACVECRKVEHGTHDHLFEVAPDGTQIKIEQIRDLQRQLANKLSRKPKVYIIHDADRMNIYAANSLLKFLEEPDTHVVAILLTNQASAILPTILSRVQHLTFAPPSVEEMRELLIQTSAENPSFAEIRTLVIQLGKALLSKQDVPSVVLHQRLPKQDVVEFSQLTLDYLTYWYKDCIAVWNRQTTDLFFADQLAWMQANVLNKPLAYWIDCFEHTLDCKKKLRHYVNPALAWDQLLIRNLG